MMNTTTQPQQWFLNENENIIHFLWVHIIHSLSVLKNEPYRISSIDQWIASREKLQETMDFHMTYGASGKKYPVNQSIE